MDVLSPDHVYYNQWQIKLGSSAYFLRVMFEIFDGNSLYVRQRRQAAIKDEDLIADILSLDGESWCPASRLLHPELLGKFHKCSGGNLQQVY